MRPGIFLGLMIAALPAAAQPADPMAEQRCVWSCLANSRGASDPRYQACVDRMCSGLGGEVAPRRSEAAPRRPEAARVTPGTWHLKSQSRRPAAGSCAPGGMCLEVTCGQSGTPTLRLDPAAERFPPGHLLLLRVDGQDFQLRAPPPDRDGWLAWEAVPPLLAALRNGTGLELLTGRGREIFGLRGSTAAITAVLRRC